MIAWPWASAAAATSLMRLLHVARRCLAGFMQSLRHRRQVEELMQLDDRILRDIGVTRLDVMRGLSARLSADPSSELMRLHQGKHCSKKCRLGLTSRRFPDTGSWS